MRIKLIMAAVLLGLLLALPATAGAISYDNAVTKLVRQGYPQRIVKKIMHFKSSAMGFRWAGSDADNAAARFLAAEMRKIGMKDVRLEPVPVDRWVPVKSSVVVGGRVLQGSPYPGTSTTAPKGRAGQIVYVGIGDAAGCEGSDLAGKIVIVDAAPEQWWFNYPAAEVKYRGAAAIILTYSPLYPGYQEQPGAFASDHLRYSLKYPPIMWLRTRDADWLKAKVAADPSTTVRFILRGQRRLATNGGHGFNVVGSVHGAAKSAGRIVIGSHHDAHFTGALDGATGCALGLTMIKAMKMSGYKSVRIVTLFSSTGSEWGYTNCDYDWAVGATHAMRTTHADWAGRVAGYLDAELPAGKGGTLGFTASEELAPWVRSVIAGNPSLARSPSGQAAYVVTPSDEDGLAFSQNDQWPFTACGIPSVTSWGQSEAFAQKKYHTQFDNYAGIDWRFFQRQVKLQWRLAQGLDRGVLPYDLKAQSEALAAAVDPVMLIESGVTADVAEAFAAAVVSFSEAGVRFEAARSRIAARQVSAANKALMTIAKEFNSAFVGMDPWDYTCYPFEQGQQNLDALVEARNALAPGQEDPAEALEWLLDIDLTWYGTQMTYDAYREVLAMRDPLYQRLNLGLLGHLPAPLDIVPQYRLVENGDYATARDRLESKATLVRVDLDERLGRLSDTLRTVANKLQQITPQ